MTDQMRSTAMGCSDVERVFTPNIDKLAQEGMRFTHAISNTPACSPARASVLTGLHTMHHELFLNDIAINQNLNTIPKELNKYGYSCGYVGKWHLDCNDRGCNIPKGKRRMSFDDYWAGVNCNHDYMQSYYYKDGNPEPIWFEGYEPDKQTELAIEYLHKKAKKQTPFFLFLSYGPPHAPYLEVPEKYKMLYPADSIELLPARPHDSFR